MIKTYFVDSFTTEPFKGNPAGVCLIEHDLSPEKMLNIAAEFGFSETAFVKKMDGDGAYSIRYFSPKKEIPLCGHTTLAAAKIVFEKTPTVAISFITVENLNLTITKSGDNIVMEFPVNDVTPLATPPAVLHALGLEAVISTSYNPKTKSITHRINF